MGFLCATAWFKPLFNDHSSLRKSIFFVDVYFKWPGPSCRCPTKSAHHHTITAAPLILCNGSEGFQGNAFNDNVDVVALWKRVSDLNVDCDVTVASADNSFNLVLDMTATLACLRQLASTDTPTAEQTPTDHRRISQTLRWAGCIREHDSSRNVVRAIYCP